MSVKVAWHNTTRTIIIYSFEGRWSWDEYALALQSCRRMLDTVAYPVDLIYDFSHAPIPPKGIVTNFRQVAVTKHHNVSGIIVAVSQSRVMRMLAHTLSQLFGRTSRNLDITCIPDTSHLNDHIEARRLFHQSKAS